MPVLNDHAKILLINLFCIFISKLILFRIIAMLNIIIIFWLKKIKMIELFYSLFRFDDYIIVSSIILLFLFISIKTTSIFIWRIFLFDFPLNHETEYLIIKKKYSNVELFIELVCESFYRLRSILCHIAKFRHGNFTTKKLENAFMIVFINDVP